VGRAAWSGQKKWRNKRGVLVASDRNLSVLELAKRGRVKGEKGKGQPAPVGGGGSHTRWEETDWGKRRKQRGQRKKGRAGLPLIDDAQTDSSLR